ncbi:Two Component Transcriptional Regulator, LuxR family [Thiobacillus denitrificans ATCC 25259]|uniref:Two Component Transcriptional Regulator, LuxR family n=1 Tax=Thiobacillus denitrificans (strain ATCC 25259 / T1) TaxID=292415 RepID=Q3SJC1_THIDA|nr:response regulator transcription factor [Thiobacillus denitrificans]AAZ97243.1 Two Component Transcriptional Regulator, LuxR family [Thiobacillus denitrificans ATCC 25259]
MIRVLIADDHAVVRQGLRHVLSASPDIVVAAEAADGFEVLEKIRKEAFDLVCLDLSMPNLSGIDLIKRIRLDCTTLPILVLSMHNEAQFAARALKAGAAGYLTKDSDPETLIGAIRKVASGRKFIDPTLVDELIFEKILTDERAPHEQLSDREFQIVRLIAQGESLNQIADKLSLSAKTISTYKARSMQKLGISNHTELVRYAIAHHWI